jgi:hypothetical protein
LNEGGDNLWLHLFPGAAGALAGGAPLVEERFSLFRAFAKAPFFGFRGIVARSGAEYRVTVAAEMDFYRSTSLGCSSRRRSSVRARTGKLCVDASWDAQTSRFADVSMLRDSHRTRPFVRGGKWLTS